MFRGGDRNPPPCRCELERVVDEIADGLVELSRIAVNGLQISGTIERQKNFGSLGLSAESLGAALKQLSDVYLAHHGGDPDSIRARLRSSSTSCTRRSVWPSA